MVVHQRCIVLDVVYQGLYEKMNPAQSHHLNLGGARSFEESFCVCISIDAAWAVSLVNLFCPCFDEEEEIVDEEEEESASVPTSS